MTAPMIAIAEMKIVTQMPLTMKVQFSRIQPVSNCAKPNNAARIRKIASHTSASFARYGIRRLNCSRRSRSPAFSFGSCGGGPVPDPRRSPSSWGLPHRVGRAQPPGLTVRSSPYHFCDS